MKKTVLALGLVLVGGVAYAGAKSGGDVYIDVANLWAQGDLGQVRNSPDNVQSIGCWAQSFIKKGAMVENMKCFATDLKGNTLSCSSSAPEMVRAARSLTGDSALLFGADASGACAFVYVAQSSELQPKQP